jgi:glycosyltransferase involved in cell wall biosynthesis
MGVDKLKIEVFWYNIFGKQLHANHRILQLKALAKRGHDVTYLMARTHQWSGDSATVGFNLDTLPLRRVIPGISLLLFLAFGFRHLVRSMGQCHAVILDLNTLLIAFPILLVRRLTSRLPAVCLRIPTNPLPGGFLRTLYDYFTYVLLVKLSLRFVDKIFFISPMLAKSYSVQFGIPETKTAVWPVAVDASIFRDRSTTRVKDLRKELGLSGRVGVLYHGAISKERGIIDLVQAFEILRRESMNVTLILLGNGPARKDIERFVRRNHLEAIIQLREPVDYSEVPDYIAACDVGIVPLPDRPWWRYQPALKLLEYLAMNKPVILSDIPAHRWIVDNPSVALYLHATSPRGIAEGIRAFLYSRDSFDASVGRRIAEEFSVEKIAEMIDNELLSGISKTMRT